jgi:hypothetical protein
MLKLMLKLSLKTDEPLTPIDNASTTQPQFLELAEDKLSLASMADRERPTHEGHGHEEEETFDSDYDEGDAVLARGYPRNHHNLVKHGFRPIWTYHEGYPEDEIPADIQEWLDENGQRSMFIPPLLFFFVLPYLGTQ